VIEVSAARSKGVSVTSEGAPRPDERPGDVAGGDEDSPTFDTSVAHVARVYDYWLGGKDNFAVDRAAGEQAIAAYPDIVFSVRANRAFLARTVRYLTAEAGIRQFLDIGTGIPTSNNTHEVAQSVAPGARVVYVDNDPIVLAHARALLASSPEGRTTYIDADLREPEKILASVAVTKTLDFSQPTALMLVAVLHFVPDEDDPAHSVSTLLDALPSGSYLVASHATLEYDPEGVTSAGRAFQDRGLAGQLRTGDELSELVFSGLEMVDPGVVPVSEWRPDGDRPRPGPAEVNVNGGVARKR
jgi:hypothetical protein